MPPIEFGPVGATRAAGPVRAATPVAKSSATSASSSTAAPAAPEVVRSPALDPGPPPVDADRVSMIRSAIQKGTYPVLPTRIADAMIAAGIMLSTPQ